MSDGPVQIETTDVRRMIAVFDQLRAATPAQKNTFIDRSLIKIDNEVKRHARSGGAFSQRSVGILARSIRQKNLGDGSGVITVGVKYGMIQEFGGTVQIPKIVAKERPYVSTFSWRKGKTVGRKTTGRTGGVLAFKVGGKMVFAKSARAHLVRIPGTHYTRTSYERVLPDIVTDADRLLASMAGGAKWP